MSVPVPTKLKEIRGTLQPCRVVPNEPNPPGALDAAPDWLTDEQRQVWCDTVAALGPDVLRRADEGCLMQYVIAFCLFRSAAQKVAADGYEVRGQRGARLVSPAVHVMNAQAVIMRQCAQELGLSPAARTRINIQADLPTDAPVNDRFGQLAIGEY